LLWRPVPRELCANGLWPSPTGVHAAYARLNQWLLVGASFVGVNLYEASLVKTDFTGVRLAQFDPLVFVDRGPGLMDAVESDDESTAGAEFVEDFGKLLRSCGGPST
jgi:hypothetical protein